MSRVSEKKAKQLALSLLFLGIGLYSVFSMERQFHNVTRLSAYVVLIVPAFLLFYFALTWFDRLDPSVQLRKHHLLLRMLSRSAPQALSQYVLAFCLPFFSRSEAWGYQAITLLLLASTLWEPAWERLLHWWPYRRILQAWTLLCAISFLLPFFFSRYIFVFYPVLAIFGVLPFIPVRRHWRHLLGNCLGVICVLALTLGAPAHWRFPVLSVWLHDPHFQWDVGRKDQAQLRLAASISVKDIELSLDEGHSLCCVAPVVAPPGLQERVSQEWMFATSLLEKPTLPTAITGNPDQRAFRSYYCKQKFPELLAGESLTCRLYLQKDIYLGQVSLKLSE